MSAHGKHAAEAGPSAPAKAFDEDSPFYAAAVSYLEGHIAIESSEIIEITLNELLASPNLNEAFLVPIRRALLDYQGALAWMSFLYQGQLRAAEDAVETGEHVPDQISLERCMAGIANIYDRAMASEVWEHFDEDGSSDEDESDEDDPEAGAPHQAEDPLGL